MYGKISRELTFAIQLAEESLEPVVKLEELVTKLTGRVSELEKQVSKDDKEKKDLEELVKAHQNLEKTMLEKFEKMEKILERTEGRLRLLEEKNVGYIDNSIQETIKETQVNRIDWKFSSPDLFGAKFTLSNNNKTTLSQTKGIDSLFAEKFIPETGKTSFSFYIEGTGGENGILGIGIAPAEAQGDPNCYRHHGTFSLHSKGFYYIQGKNYVNERLKCGKGDKVSFAVDMETGEVIVSVNSEVIYTHNIPSWHINTYKAFYPFILTNFSAGIGVTFCD